MSNKNEYEQQYSIYSVCRNVWGSILVTATHLALAQNILTDPVTHPAPYSEGIVSPFPRAHWQGSETDHSLPSRADNVNVWSNTCAPAYAITVCKNRKCTLLLLCL
jgi:hypothetical protein